MAKSPRVLYLEDWIEFSKQPCALAALPQRRMPLATVIGEFNVTYVV
jgi:hypothetical protein